MLNKLLADLLTDSSKREAFAKAPEKLFQEYELTEPQKTVLLSGNLESLMDLLLKNLNQGDPRHTMDWPAPEGSILTVCPFQTQAGADLSNIIVCGRGLPQGATMSLQLGDFQIPNLPVGELVVSDVYSALNFSNISIPADAPKGKYTIEITNAGKLEDAFEIG